MADVKISALAAATSAASTDEYAANQLGTSRKVTLQQIHDAYVLGRGGAAANINNSAATTSIYSCAIPANVMGTNRTVRTKLIGEYWHSVGATATLTLRIGLSTTTMYQDASAALAVSANTRPVWIDVHVTNLGASNSQVLGGELNIGATGGATTGQGDLATAGTSAVIRGTAAVDTTSAVTLDFFVTHSAASTLITYRHWAGITELV